MGRAKRSFPGARRVKVPREGLYRGGPCCPFASENAGLPRKTRMLHFAADAYPAQVWLVLAGVFRPSE